MSNPVLTADLAARIDAAHEATAASRMRHVAMLPGNPLGVQTLAFGALRATLVRHGRWYYHFFNGVDGLRPGVEDGLDEALAWFRAAGQRCRIGVSPLAADETFMARLIERGVRPASFMSITYGLATDEPSSSEPGVTVREDRDAYLAARLLTAPADEQEFLRSVQAAEFVDWRGYVAEIEGEIAGRAALLIVDGVGSMAAGDTTERFRGRGPERTPAPAHRRRCGGRM